MSPDSQETKSNHPILTQSTTAVHPSWLPAHFPFVVLHLATYQDLGELVNCQNDGEPHHYQK